MLVLLPVIPALALALQRNFGQRRSERERVLQHIDTVSRLISANELGFIKNARQLLTTLAPLDFLVQASNEEFASVHFRNLVKLSPDYLNFGLIESNGTLFASAVAATNSARFLGDRSYFKRALQSGGFSIGDYQVGRLTQEESVNFAFPILDPSGAVKRILFASLKLERLTHAAREVTLPEGAIVTIVDRGGTILARLPEPASWVGSSLPDMSLVRDVLRAQEGTMESTGLDGIHRIYAVTPLRDDMGPSLFVAVGVPSELLFASANYALKRNLLVLGLTVIITLSAASIFAERAFVRPIDSLAGAANQVARGNLQARAALAGSTAELRRLSESFNTMAERLQSRDAELSKAHQEIQAMNLELERKVLDRTAQLSAANQELEAFSYSVSHDLRAPLRHLDGFAELLRRQQRDRLDETGRRHLEVISQAARKMGTLIDELLVFSRMGRQDLLKTTVSMNTLVRESIAQLQPDCASRTIEWIVSDLPQVEADPAMLKLVWLNLISNAIKYSRPRATARIEIASFESGDEYQFFVRDNGVGFDMKYADKLFGVFQRLHSESEFEGTGIGLANVRRIILRHRGRTWAESAPDQFSTFYFSMHRS